jgi:GNAT superfamily N-acetyltransferase
MILDLGDGHGLRQATESDHAALCMICLRTGDAGRDATAREDDPDLLGLIYAVPYQVLEPGLAFVVDGPNGPAGYVLGARDTIAFNARALADWYPSLQRRVRQAPSDRSLWRGSDWARALIHDPAPHLPTALADYPSHGHIDLLPELRGHGIGRRIVGHLEDELRRVGSPGLNFEVDPRNSGAQAFYQRLGFAPLRATEPNPHSVIFAKRLGRSQPRGLG